MQDPPGAPRCKKGGGRHVRKRKVWVISPLFYGMGAAMLAMGAFTWQYDHLAALVELTAAVLCLAGVGASDLLYHRNVNRALRSAERVLTAAELEALENFGLPVAVAAPAGDVVWANGAFARSLGARHDYVGVNVQTYLYPRTLRQVMDAAGVAVTHRGREYSVYGAPARDGASILYFVDETDFKAIEKEHREQRVVVCMAAFDNREELVHDSVGGDDSRVTAEVEAVLRRWVVEEMGGFIRRYSTGRYVILTDDAHVEAAKQKRFRVLDDVRSVKNAGGMSATVSIGVGRGAASAAESESWARQALDMALGRGGDQVAVKAPEDTYEFFGGNSKGVEKRDKVRTRVIAATLTDHVKDSDRVFIMGHKNSDLDSLGSAVGLWAAITKGLEKPAAVVVARGQSLAGVLIDRVERAYPGQRVFISPPEAVQNATDRSLLIVTDTHSVNLVESRELLDRVPRVVVVDHHRMMVSHITNALIFYHEPYASSASEMVTELVQYIKASAIDGVDAEALLAGISLDTKNFIMHTGVRTFEASAFLRRRGADTVNVKRLFSGSMEDYKLKAQLVSGAEIYRGCAIALSGMEQNGMRVAAAQAADELLSIQGVRASFVLFRQSGGVNISARSLGDLNVQVILEGFGGGGHFSGAGAQIPNASVVQVRRELLAALDRYLNEESKKG